MVEYGIQNRGRAQANKVAVRSNEAFVWCTGAAWNFYRTVLSGPAELIIPEHTRDAFFQLWCDLRTNVPKDRNWVRQHATALQPKTSVGYIALASFAAFVTAAGSSLLCLALATLAVLGYALVGAFIIAGLTAGFWLLVFSGILFVSSFVIAWTASTLAAGYVFLASTAAVLTYLRNLVSQRKTPLQESRQAADTVKSSRIPIAAASPENATSFGKPSSAHTNSSASSNARADPFREERAFPDDLSPGRAPDLLGTADVQKTEEARLKVNATT